MRFFNNGHIINRLCVFIASVFVLISCSGNQSGPAQFTGDETGEVAFQILYERPESAISTIQSIDACDDVVWVRASVLDENSNVLLTGENWQCEVRSGILTGVPAGKRRKVAVSGLDQDGQTVLYFGVSDFFPVSPDIKNLAGKVIVRHIDDVDQDGDGFTPNEGDCNDDDNAVNPGAKDLCNDEIDQDCNAATCVPSIWYADRDNDNFGDAEETVTSVQCPNHYVADRTDCNDGDSNINPKSTEQCNGIDDDCDGLRDEGCPWVQTYDKGDFDMAHSMIQAVDGGYVITGQTTDEEHGTWVIKTDELGEKVWDTEYHYGSGIYGIRTDVLQADDGNYIVAGSAEDDRAWLAKIDEKGNEIWFEFFEGVLSHCVVQTMEGGYVILAEGQTGMYSIKTDANGIESWRKSLPDLGQAKSVVSTNDGGYIVAGNTLCSEKEESICSVLIRIDKNGNELWTEMLTFDGSYYQTTVGSIIQTDDGGYVVVGEIAEDMESRDSNVWALKFYEEIFFQHSFRLVWKKIFDSPKSYSDGEYYMPVVDQTQDGGFIIAGNNDTVWYLKIDKNGNSEWEKAFDDNNATIQDVVQCSDGGYAFAGWVTTGTIGTFISPVDFLIVKTEADGEVPLMP